MKRLMQWLLQRRDQFNFWLDNREPWLTARQHTIMGWSLLALGRGALYSPVFPGYGDFPPPLRALFPEDKVWISGTIWLIISVVGFAYALFPHIPAIVIRSWWTLLIAGVFGWASLYCSSIFFVHGIRGWQLFAAGELYFAVGYVIASTRGEEPEAPSAWRQRRDRNASGGN